MVSICATLGRRVPRALLFRLLQGTGRLELVEVSNDEGSPAEHIERVRDWAEYSGFFMSEDYFASAADEIRRLFVFREERARRFRALYAELAAGGYTCVHVRLTDYLHHRGGIDLPWAYYRESLARLAPEGPVVFVSDDIESVRREFADVPSARFESNDAGVDMMLLVHAKAVVTSNSSFAWWGAWLGDPARPVFAARNWVGFKEGLEVPAGRRPRPLARDRRVAVGLAELLVRLVSSHMQERRT